MSRSRFNPFRQQVSFSASWISRQLDGTGEPNIAGWCRCRCPAHDGDSTNTLALKNAGGRLIARCFKDCPEDKIHHEIGRLFWEGHFDLNLRAGQSSVTADDTDEHERIGQAARIWHPCLSIHDSLAETYLRIRGIMLRPLPNTLRFHPDLTHAPSGRRWPAMVALAQDIAGQPRAIHRTWLTSDGTAKAPVEKSKMALAPISGCAVRLAEVTDTLIVAEGIESALSVTMILGGQPAWAALSTSGVQALQIPSVIRTVTIAADHDEPGLAAARSLCNRLEAEGRSVRIIRPTQPGNDFNDVLRSAA